MAKRVPRSIPPTKPPQATPTPNLVLSPNNGFDMVIQDCVINASALHFPPDVTTVMVRGCHITCDQTARPFQITRSAVINKVGSCGECDGDIVEYLCDKCR